MPADTAAPGELTPAFTDLVFEDLGPVARLTLNRPSVVNALSIRLSSDLIRAFEFLRDSDQFKVVVLQGAGGNFSAGDDLGEMGSGKWGNVNQAMRRVRLYQHMANTLEELDKITICSVDGYCVGGGLELTMACDFVICTERARWGMPEIDWGIHPGWGGTTRLARLIGRRMAKEINLLGALHPARRGKELGLFNRIVADDALDAETQALIDLLLTKNQQGLRQLKFSLNKNVEADLYTAQGFEVLGGVVTRLAGRDGVEDADSVHGWATYASKDPASPTRRRRELARDFWFEVD
jgi:enoyl-CoA hydratase